MHSSKQGIKEQSASGALIPENLEPLRMRRRDVSVIASTWLVKNKESAAEGLIIDGNLECAAVHHQRHLTIGEHARVEANIHARTVVVFGHLTGDIFCEGKVYLARGAEVWGEICCACLYIEEGARIMGRVAVGESAVPADLEYG